MERCTTPKQVLELCKKRDVKFIDLRFMDFPGLWQHLTVPVDELAESSFEHGFGFDGSSLRGWQAINESDMLIVPVAETAMVDPFMPLTTVSLLCDVKDPRTRKEYSRDPRSIARKCAEHLKRSGIGDTAYFGPELEFFIFDRVRYDQTINSGFYFIDAFEGVWNRGLDDPNNKGHKVRQKEGYFPVPPTDSDHDLRSEMVAMLQEAGIRAEAHHHEVATGGQAEIDMRYQELVHMADSVMMYKYIVKAVAARHGKTVTFMPKPLFGDNGSGMHVHTSIWKAGRNLFAGTEYAGLSQEGLWAIGGLIHHAASLVAFTSPTTNSYKRLVPGYEAPVNLCYSSSNRSAAIRIPIYSDRPETKRLEFRVPDSSCNPYLAFAAMTMAMIDGIQRKIDPGEPVDKDIYRLEPEELARIPSTPGSLEEALNCLDKDHAYLLAGDVFTPDVIHYWIRYKMENEVEAIRTRPHPFEFCMYFDM